jgi:hypothetical protein
MKLIYCTSCGDILALDYKLRSCQCGKCKGKYTDSRLAVTNGQGVALVISTPDLHRAALWSGFDMNQRKGFSDNPLRMNLQCFVRDNDGVGNPHTTIDANI